METWIWIKGISYDDIMELYIEMQTTAWFTFPYDNWGGIDEIRYRSYYCAPSGARFLRVKVPNPPGSGKDIAEGKGVRREAESEGSWMWREY